MIKNNILFLSLILLSANSVLQAQKVTKLKPVKHASIDTPEPSDICYNAQNDSFFIASDTGVLFEINREGKIIRKQKQKDTDFEAVYSDNQYVYAVDESGRTIYQYEIQTLQLKNTIQIPYNGPRNKGFESFTYDAARNKYLLITESHPALIFELDSNFNVVKKTDISTIAKDISSARFYKDELFLLSDEDMMLIKVNPITY